MELYYNVSDIEDEDTLFDGIQVHKGGVFTTEGPRITYDFSKHVLVELLDNVTPESKLWKALGIFHNKNVVHKRLLVDPHRVNCRRAIIVCTSSEVATDMAKRLTQAKIMKRCVCAIVIQELLSDLRLFEKQIIQYGDKGSQQQLVYVTDLNRPRETASLARYLKEKFSPFGTILSVFVSEGNDGYALPEGVIKFSHLSEAFAAELAYDQCAVAMERLSVTTHHNILLSQCDLKARLKKACMEHTKNANSGSILPKMRDPVLNSLSTDADVQQTNSTHSSMTSETVEPPVEEELDDENNSEEPFPTNSEELANALRTPCKDNLVDCLKDIAADTESSISKRTTIYTVSASGAEYSECDSKLPIISKSVSNLGEKSWSTRVLGWISEIPSADEMPQYSDSGEERLTNENAGSQVLSSGCHAGADFVSNSGSFVTCKNGDLNESFNSNMSSVSNMVYKQDLNNTVVQRNSDSKDSGDLPPYTATSQHAPSLSPPLSLNDEDICPAPTSQKRKNSSLMTQKLPLKNQRSDSSHVLSDISENDTTIRLSLGFKNRPCHIVLERLPDLTITSLVGNDQEKDKRSTSNSKSSTSKSSKRARREDSTASQASSATGCSRSLRSLPIRRAAKRGSQESQKISSSCQDGAQNQNEQESPLRSWLKKELMSSTNNRMAESKESSKSILCVTANKDVLVSVGCSHMTCNYCYPDSTKLLLGDY